MATILTLGTSSILFLALFSTKVAYGNTPILSETTSDTEEHYSFEESDIYWNDEIWERFN